MKNLRPGFFFLLAFCLMAELSPLYAGGRKDEDLSRADTLIETKQYDDAVLALAAFMKKNPDNFVIAQERLEKILGIRGDYNKTATQLMDTLVNDSSNSAKILALTNKLKSLESPKNPAAEAFIERTRKLALFALNRNRLQDILEQGRELLAKKDYAGAFAVYAGGLDIYQEEFFQMGYGPDVEGRVRTSIASMQQMNKDFAASIAGFRALADEAEAADRANAPPAAMADVYRRLVPGVNTMAGFVDSLRSTITYYEDRLARFQQADPELNDRSYLSFAIRLIDGPIDSHASEGMEGAVAGLWGDVMPRISAAAGNLADRAYDAALASTGSGAYQTALDSLAAAAAYANSAIDLANLNTRFSISRGNAAVTVMDSQITANVSGGWLKWRGMIGAAAIVAEADRLGLQYQTYSQRAAANISGAVDDRMAREEEFRANFASLEGGGKELVTRLDGEKQTYEAVPAGNGAIDASQAVAVMDKTRPVLLSMTNDFAAAGEQSVQRYYAIANGELEDRVKARQDDLERAKSLFNGQTVTREDGSAYLAKYPQEALAILTRMDSDLTADEGAAANLLKRYTGEGKQGPSEQIAAVRQMGERARQMDGELDSIRAEGRGIAAQARTQIAQADTYRIDGDRLFQEARNAMNQGNFDTARDRIQRSADRYNASLAIQESASLRREWDTRLVNLGQDIHRLENEAVIREVRRLVNGARDTYFNGNFDTAEEMLVRAQNRWRVTNTDENTEVTYWLNVVRGALSLRSGRTIPATAPLYTEMSQLLSDANLNYNEGAALIRANQRAAGIAKFNEARKKTQEVKLMFPVNQEAGMLELRMDQITDPAAFNAGFQRRFSEAVAGTKPNRRSLESFAELQNLAEINPRWPGMRAAITQAEIDMGYRLPPPDPRALARSTELTNLAAGVIDRNDRMQYQVALKQLDEALTLNPNNSRAMTLKDRAQTALSGEGNVVLGSAAEQEYRRAVQELQQGNTLVALSIVQQLLQDPKNRSSTRIIELQRRIQSVL